MAEDNPPKESTIEDKLREAKGLMERAVGDADDAYHRSYFVRENDIAIRKYAEAHFHLLQAIYLQNAALLQHLRNPLRNF